MRILVINYEYPPLGGGGGVATRQLVHELGRRHEVHVLTTWYSGLAREESEGSVHVHRVRVVGRHHLPTATLVSLLTFFPAALVRGIALCWGHRFAVINAHFVLPSGLVGVVLARLFRIPFVLSFIGGDLFDPTKGISPHRYAFLRLLIRWIARSAAACTAISQDTKQRARELHGVRSPITVTHLGIQPVSQQALSRHDLELPEDELVFISVGRLIPRKRYDVLIDAWRDVPQGHLVIVGDGPLQAVLRQRVADYGLSQRVSFTGYVDEKRKYALLQSADVYVSAAEHEGFGLVFLEAMACGLPIVATDLGGHVDFLKQDVNALLVSPHDAAGLSAMLRRLHDDAELRSRMAAANRAAVPQFYLDKTVHRFEQVLVKAVDSFSAASHSVGSSSQ